MRVRLHWTPSSIAHIERHGVYREDVDALIRGHYLVRRVGGRYRLIGSTFGRTLTVFVEPSSEEPGSYEVVTVRGSTAREKRLIRKEGR